MSKQAYKYNLSLSGEFLVAGELLRRGVPAAVTYGNAKSADVVAYHEGRATTIEVKTTSQKKWVLGGLLPDDSSSLWVLVHLPPDTLQPPEYIVVTSSELRRVLLPRHEAYNAAYLKKNNKEFDGKGVVSVLRNELDDSSVGAWWKVIDAVGLSSTAGTNS